MQELASTQPVRAGSHTSRKFVGHLLKIVKDEICGAGEDSWESLGQQGDQTSQS